MAEKKQKDLEAPGMRPLVWLGNSRTNIQEFPPDARCLTAGELQFMQSGEMPEDVRPFEEIGPGVVEIALEHEGEAYRTVVALQLGAKIYVLHAFQRISETGNATPTLDVDLIRQRYNEAKELSEDERE